MTKDYLSNETAVMHYTESVYFWRIAHCIGPKKPLKEDRGIAKEWLKYWQKHKKACFCDWVDKYFKSSHRRHN